MELFPPPTPHPVCSVGSSNPPEQMGSRLGGGEGKCPITLAEESSFWLPVVQNPAPGFLVSVLIVLKVSVALEKQPVDTNQWCFAIRMQMVFPLLE